MNSCIMEPSCVLFLRMNDFRPRNDCVASKRSKSTLKPGFTGLRLPVPRERMPISSGISM